MANKPKKDDPNKVEERWVVWSDLEAGVNLKAGHPVVLLLGDHHTPGNDTTLAPAPSTGTTAAPAAPGITTTAAPSTDTSQGPPTAATTAAPPSDATTQPGPSGNTTAPPSAATTTPGDATGAPPPQTSTEPPNPGTPATTTTLHPAATTTAHPAATTTAHPANTTTAHPAATTTAHPSNTTTAHPAATTTAHPSNTTTIKKGKRYKLSADHFDTAKSFPKPEKDAFDTYKTVAALANGDSTIQLLILGHTDTMGTGPYNLKLSDERAGAVKAFLINDVESWMPFYSHSDPQKRWGLLEDQYMLTALPDAKDGSAPTPPSPYYSRTPNGVSNADFTAALKKFQADAGEPATGTVNASTRRKLIAAYMALEGTSINDTSTTIQSKGCGKVNLAAPTPDKTPSAANRRTEIYVFYGAVTPDVSAWDKDQKGTYAAWLANTDDDSVAG